jgi:hypothetical protein
MRLPCLNAPHLLRQSSNTRVIETLGEEIWPSTSYDLTGFLCRRYDVLGNTPWTPIGNKAVVFVQPKTGEDEPLVRAVRVVAPAIQRENVRVHIGLHRPGYGHIGTKVSGRMEMGVKNNVT